MTVEGPTTGPFQGLCPKTERVWAEAHAALSRGDVVSLDLTTTTLDPDGNTVGTPGDTTKEYEVGDAIQVVAEQDLAAGVDGWFTKIGIVDANVTATTAVAVGDALSPTASSAFTIDELPGKFVAIALEVLASGSSVDRVYFNGEAGVGGGLTLGASGAQLTDSTGGTANDTLVAISGSGDDADINNNFADLAAKVNFILEAMGF